MKKQNLILAGISVLALAVLGGYRIVDGLRTDTVPPALSFETDTLTLSVRASEDAYLSGVTAHDEHDGDVTAGIIVESIYGMNDAGETTVTYAAFDKAGNVTKATRTVLYEDYTAPRFSLSVPLVYEYGTIFDVLDDVRATDVIDGDLSSSVKATMTTSGSTVTEEGVHEVLFRVTNSLGDTASLSLPVEVYPVDTYSADLSLDTYLLYLPIGADFDADEHPTTLRVRGTTICLTEPSSNGVRIRTQGEVDTEVPGIYTVTYTASYSADGVSYTGYTKLFAVVEDDIAADNVIAPGTNSGTAAE